MLFCCASSVQLIEWVAQLECVLCRRRRRRWQALKLIWHIKLLLRDWTKLSAARDGVSFFVRDKFLFAPLLSGAQRASAHFFSWCFSPFPLCCSSSSVCRLLCAPFFTPFHFKLFYIYKKKRKVSRSHHQVCAHMLAVYANASFPRDISISISARRGEAIRD